MAEKFPYLYLFLLEGRPSVELPKNKRCLRWADANSLSWFGWGAHIFWLSRILLGGTESKKGRGQPCMVLLDRVSEGQLNKRLMKAAGLDEPITRTRS
ncbi:hypothetical protein HN873_022158, partial [Arachis hypogaea]